MATTNFIGFEFNGKLHGGSANPQPLPVGKTASLPISFTTTLPDGDQFKVAGNFKEVNQGKGKIGLIAHASITYVGDGHGGVSKADTLNADLLLNWVSSVAVSANITFSGQFSPTIGSGSSAEAVVISHGTTEATYGPFASPTAFHQTKAFTLPLVSGTVGGDVKVTSVFAAGSPAGSSVKFGQTPPCFLAGTRIATPTGDTAVEDLRVGESALTAAGESRPIVWIGSRRVECRQHPHPPVVWPIRVRAGAFGDHKPCRDLWLSSGHSVYCEGVLIPIEHLVNGATVVQEQAASAHYFHVELDQHDVLVAEGLPAESYLDDGNRAAFENGAAHLILHPDFAPQSWDDACAPRCTDGPALIAARRLLHERALELGYRVAAGADLRVLADGDAVLPAAVIGTRGKLFRSKGTLYRFLLPPGTREVRIVSPTGVAAWLDPASQDRRELGARIGAVYLDERIVPLTSRWFADGFHEVERLGRERWRWTDGAARLMVPERACGAGPMPLDLFVRDTMQRWHQSADSVRLAA